jgi:sulfur carrier protein
MCSLRIYVNGKAQETDAPTLAALCAAQGYGADARIATALNGDFVPAGRRTETPLGEGDHVEIVSPRQGG